MSRSGVHPSRMSDSLKMLLSGNAAVADRAAARLTRQPARERLEERHATGGDEQLSFHEAPPGSRVETQGTERERTRQPCRDGGRSTANSSVASSLGARKRKTAAGRPPPRPGFRRSPVASMTPRRSSTR